MKLKHLLAGMMVWAGNGAAAQAFDYSNFTQLGVYKAVPAQALVANANSAALPHFKNFVATAYGENRFLLEDLSLIKLGLVLPLKTGAFGLQASPFGSAYFNQSKVGLGYGRSLSDQLSVGVQFNYLHYHLAGYGNAGAVTADMGAIYQFNQGVSAGVQIKNVTGSSFYQLKSEKQPRIIAAGLGYAPSESFYMQAAIVKEAQQPLQVQAGMQYTINKLHVTGGLQTASTLFYMGVGYNLNFIQVDAVAHWHQHLGITPGIMLTFNTANH